VPAGSHLDRLLEAAGESSSDLILVGHRRTARGRRSSSRRLAMKAPCSVWMVPEGVPPRISAVLAAADFSQPSAHAVSLATLIAQRAGLGKCAVLHVIPPNVLSFDAVEQKEVGRAFERFLNPLDLHGVDIRQVVVEGGSVAGAAAHNVASNGVDLLVLGTRGRSPSAAVLLGSESEGVLLESTVPVLVTKDRGERLGILSALLGREFPTGEPQFG
jgi:nucleotide-binding universal stress UspA family protein